MKGLTNLYFVTYFTYTHPLNVLLYFLFPETSISNRRKD